MMQNTAQDELNFIEQPEGLTAKVSAVKVEKSAGAQTFHFTHFDGGQDESTTDDTSQLIQAPPSPWTFAYYQDLFDVNTDNVVRRMMNSFIPRLGTNFIEQQLKPARPDLWGPVWICITLVFSIAVSGNVHSYLAIAWRIETPIKWNYDFGLVSASAAAVFTYAWFVPILLWGFLQWRRSAVTYTCFELLCLYGYSLSVFIPVSILWAIPLSSLQWIMILISTFLSCAVIVIAIWPAVKNDSFLVSVISIATIAFAHAALAVGFKMYFFYSPDTTTMLSTFTPLSGSEQTTNSTFS